MKRMKRAFLCALTASLVFSCVNPTNPASSSSSSSTTGGTTFTVPVTSAADDAKATGVYKGIIAYEGSGGDFNIEIKNATSPSIRAIGDHQATMYVRINNDVAKVTGTILSDSASGISVRFSWTQLSKNYSVTLYMDSTGGTPLITNLTVNSTSVSTNGIQIYKDKSTSPVSVWVGTFSGSGGTTSIQGVFNYIVQGNLLKGAWAGQATTPTGQSYEGDYFSGSGGSASVTISLPNTGAGMGSATGTVSGSSVTGTWTKDGMTGTWNGTKTM